MRRVPVLFGMWNSHASLLKGATVEAGNSPAEKVGVIGCAFGQQDTETAGPSNEMIGRVVRQIVNEEQRLGNEAYISTQWEVECFLEEWAEPADFLVSEYDDPETRYIDTLGVIKKSLDIFEQLDVTRIIIVAHPLHMVFIRLLISTKIWKVGDVKVDWSYGSNMKVIPYDKSLGNQQSWTRGPFVFIAYLFKTLFTGKHGNWTFQNTPPESVQSRALTNRFNIIWSHWLVNHLYKE